MKLQHEWAAGLTNAKVVELGCGHYVHNFEPARIAAEIKSFLDGIGDRDAASGA